MVAVLGVLNFICGFLPEIVAARTDISLSVYAVGPAYAPILLLVAGLLALAPFIPGSGPTRLVVAALSVGAAAGAIVSLGTAGSVELVTTSQVSKGLGAILLVVFGIVQAVVAIGAYIMGTDVSTGSADRSIVGAPVVAAPGSSVPFGGQPGWERVQYGPVVGTYSGAAGYPSPPGYPSPAQYARPETEPGRTAHPAPSRSSYAEEPATGPQIVVGTESYRGDPRHAERGDHFAEPTSDVVALGKPDGPGSASNEHPEGSRGPADRDS
jgi:Family of unknown function (DUF5336)